MGHTLTPQTTETPQEDLRIAISNDKALGASTFQWAWSAPAPAYMAAEVQELFHFIRMDRRAAVRYIFCGVYGMPLREEWQLEGGKTLVSEIAMPLNRWVTSRNAAVAEGR